MGPKFSSATASASSGRPVITVGSKKKPLFWPVGRPPPVSILPPRALASATIFSIASTRRWLMSGPIWVASSRPWPSFRAFARAVKPSTKGFTSLSCT